MRIGIIGAGNMGAAFARRLSAARHEVAIASRDLADAKKVATSVGNGVRAVPQNELANHAEILIAATPYQHQAEALRATGDLSGRIVIEISNPMTEDMSSLAVGLTTSAAEEVARSVGNAAVVKAFNTVFAQVLGQPAARANASPVQVFYAADDSSAKETVRALIESMGFEPIDAGPLRNARYLEPMGMLNIYFGYVAGLGTDIAPSVRKVSPPAVETRADQAPERTEPAAQRVARDDEGRTSAG
jgi:predicted dinucleotide-binding enzyme